MYCRLLGDGGQIRRLNCKGLGTWIYRKGCKGISGGVGGYEFHWILENLTYRTLLVGIYMIVVVPESVGVFMVRKVTRELVRKPYCLHVSSDCFFSGMIREFARRESSFSSELLDDRRQVVCT